MNCNFTFLEIIKQEPCNFLKKCISLLMFPSVFYLTPWHLCDSVCCLYIVFLDALFSCVCLYIIINNLLQLGVLEALKLDRTPIEGRPMFVSKCEDRSQKKAQFKVGKCVMTRAFIMMIKSTLWKGKNALSNVLLNYREFRLRDHTH